MVKARAEYVPFRARVRINYRCLRQQGWARVRSAGAAVWYAWSLRHEWVVDEEDGPVE